MIKRIEYLDLVPIDILYELIFSLDEKIFEKDDTVLEKESQIDSIYFVEDGIIDVITEFEDNQFLLDKLGPGSVINYRAVFLNDEMYVNM